MSFFHFFFPFYWSMADSQSCVSYRCTAVIQLHIYYIHFFKKSIFPYRPSEYWAAFPVLCSMFLSVIYLIYIGEGNGSPLLYSCLENPMGGGAWWAAVHGVAKSRTRLSHFTFTFHFHGLEKEMATHSSVLAWRIPGKGDPGGMLSMGLHRVRQD